MTEIWRHPEAIVCGEWLEAHLRDPNLRIYDCTTYLRYEEGTGRPYRVESGRADWKAGHIPGAMHLDLQADFSDDGAPTRFMWLPPEATAAASPAMGSAMRRAWSSTLGIVRSGRRGSGGCCAGSGSTMPPSWKAAWIYGKQRDGQLRPSLPAIRGARSRRVRAPASSSEKRRCWRQSEMARSARLVPSIPGCTAERTRAMAGPDASRARPMCPRRPFLTLRARLSRRPKRPLAFSARQAPPDKRILNYCGGGIAATLDAFLQHQLGYPDIAVYDASMSEWAKDEALPIESDGDNKAPMR